MLNRKHLLGIGFGILVVVISLLFFRKESFFYFLLSIAFVIALIPFVLGVMFEQGRQQEKEEKFLAFSRDLVENVRSGTPINKSIINLKNRDYGSLSPHVQKLSNQLLLGINLNFAFETFGRDTNSVVIMRAVGLISEAERAGGRIETILDSVSKSINQTENLKKERKASISNLVTQGYIIFLVFIVIMLVLEFKILPLVTGLSGGEGLGVNVRTVSPEEFSSPLFIMLLIQSFFAGLVIGKISEGSVMSGIKHSFILVALTILITTGSRALFGG
jgi:flagellar protein FlaJ